MSLCLTLEDHRRAHENRARRRATHAFVRKRAVVSQETMDMPKHRRTPPLSCQHGTPPLPVVERM